MSSTLDAILEAIDEVKKEKNSEAEDVEEFQSNQNQQERPLGELNSLTTKEASPGAVRREMNAARKRIARLNETPEEKEKRRAKDAERNRRLRSQETEEQKARRREKNAARGREKRRLEATKEAELIYKILGESSPNIARKELDAARKREKRKVETEEERAVRLAKNSERNRILRQNESEEQRQRRLESNARRGRERRKTEDPESRKIRLQLNAERERARRHAKAKNSDYYEKMMKDWSGKGYIHPTRSSAGSSAPSYASSRTSDGASPSLLDIKQELGSSTVEGSTREGSIEMDDEKRDIWQKLLDMTGQAASVSGSSEDLVPDIPAPDSPVDEAMDSEQASIWEQLLDMAERSQKTETQAEPHNENSSSELQPVVQLFSENMQSLVFPGEKAE